MKKTETTAEKTARLKAARIARDGQQAKETPIKNRRFLGLDDELSFGKHIGETVADVINDDPNWLRWAIDEGIIELNARAEADLVAMLELCRGSSRPLPWLN